MTSSIRLATLTGVISLLMIHEINPQPTGMYLESSRSFRRVRFRRFLDIPETWTKFTRSVTTFVDHTVPETIQRFIPKAFQRDGREIVGKEQNSGKERGQLDFVGREWLKGIGNLVKKTGINSNTTFLNGRFSLGFIKHIKAIYPGTVFCGDGNAAKGKNDLGYFKQVDGCCRDHDYCNDYIPAGEIRYGLENSGLFTRSHCDCDNKFYNCLKQVDGHSIVAKKIGFTFFTVLGPQCFKEEYPVLKCNEHSWGRCIKYGTDTSREKRAQWFDNPTF